MSAVEVVFGVGWAAFWLYWLVAAFSTKRGRVRWSRELRIRGVLAVIVILLIRLGAFRTHGVNTDPLRAGVGLAVFATGLGLAVWARLNLGRNWGGPMTRKTHPELVTSGPYQLVRHPIYSGILLAGAGTAVAFGWQWLLAVAVAGIYFLYSAIVEERDLTVQFPEDYPSYKHSTKMLIPFVSSRPSSANATSSVTSLAAALGRHGDALRELPTPCLVADLDAVRANLRAGSDAAGALGAQLRPHAKAHKCSSLLRLQLAEEHTTGVTCATSAEALALARLGFDDVLVANEVVSRAGVAELAGAAAQLDRLALAVDSEAGVAAAAAAAAASGRELGVLVDLDVGSGRCGLPPASDAALAVAQAVAAAPGLRLDGLMGYASHANKATDTERRRVAAEVKAAFAATRGRLAENGLAVATVSGGSTGMWNVDQGLTELQLGSYALMELSYASALDSPFRPALYCAATVISRPASDRTILDAGWKALSGELGLPLAPAGLEPFDFSDEHLSCRGSAYEVGDQVLLVPAHLDPTMNLHPRVFVLEGNVVVDDWPIDLRR
jgi:D-serine deaminase-like pyridoxal phosphate-dependent protein/protein-S-isoprenylcysteine O-methyltransferase Ste14